MPIRRRFATREELLELLAGREPDVDWEQVLAVLEELGVVVGGLVKVEVREEA